MFLALMILAEPGVAGQRGADGKFSERKSRHFLLLQDVAIDRYSGANGIRQFERSVLATLENAHDSVRNVLGIGPSNRIQVQIFDPDLFDQRFASLFRFRAAGFYNGVIHVRGNTVVDGRLVRTLHHEYLHAAIGTIGGHGRFPGWLNEGLAEYFERLALGRRLMSQREHDVLHRVVQQGAWIPLAQLSRPSFQGMGPNYAGLAYLQSFATVEYLLRNWGARKMRSLCERLAKNPSIDLALRRTYRLKFAEMERGLLAELQ